jgi:hypothetical protein
MTEGGLGFARVGAAGKEIGSVALGQEPVLGTADNPPGFRQ